jgi:hypothetical protein
MFSYINITYGHQGKGQGKAVGKLAWIHYPKRSCKGPEDKRRLELEIELQKSTNIERLFGIAHGKRQTGLTTQQIKDELRAGWKDDKRSKS